MITAGIVGHDAVADRLGALPQGMAASLAREVDRLGRALQQRVERNLSGAVLQRRSGRLVASVSVDVARRGGEVTATIAAGAPYAAIHEYGGTIPARQMLPRNGRVLSFPWRGRERFFARVLVPAARMPERSFMRSALAEMAPEIRAALLAVTRETASRVAPT